MRNSTTKFSIAAAAVALLLVTACGGGKSTPPEPSADPTTTTSPSVTAEATDVPVVATTTGPAPVQFTVDGTGPYQLGVSLTSLQTQGVLAEVATGSETCPQNTSARGTGAWTDVRMSFRPDGKLYLVTNRAPGIPTPSGAYLGFTLAQLNTIYAGVTHELLAAGSYQAFLVTTLTGRGILFDLTNQGKVFTMTAGEADYLKSSYVNGTDFC
jgi:hypothetical protein